MQVKVFTDGNIHAWLSQRNVLTLLGMTQGLAPSSRSISRVTEGGWFLSVEATGESPSSFEVELGGFRRIAVGLSQGDLATLLGCLQGVEPDRNHTICIPGPGPWRLEVTAEPDQAHYGGRPAGIMSLGIEQAIAAYEKSRGETGGSGD